MELPENIETKITELVTAWAEEYLIDKPVTFAWVLNAGITREIEKATKVIKETEKNG